MKMIYENFEEILKITIFLEQTLLVRSTVYLLYTELINITQV